MAPARRPATENTIDGLAMLADEHTVVVTGEEHHQDALAWYAPRPDGRPRLVGAELRSAPIPRGRHAGQRGIEVLIDGRRVGELTHQMSRRYGPLVERMLAGGARPGCLAQVIDGRRDTGGRQLVEVTLRLPTRPGAPPAPLPPSATPGPGRPTRPGPPPAATPPGGRGPGSRRGRSRRPLWIAGGVGTLLLAIGVAVGGQEPSTPLATGPRANVAVGQSATTPPPTPTPTPTVTPTPTAPPAAPTPSVDLDTPAASLPVSRRRTPAATTRPSTASAAAPAAARSTTTRPPATTSTSAKKKPAAGSSGGGCDPNYSGCVPIASDVDCAGGSGNGPAYVSGPVRVLGTDKYGLDRDKDGTGCD